MKTSHILQVKGSLMEINLVYSIINGTHLQHKFAPYTKIIDSGIPMHRNAEEGILLQELKS